MAPLFQVRISKIQYIMEGLKMAPLHRVWMKDGASILGTD